MTRKRFSATALMARLLEFDGKCADPECRCKLGGSHSRIEWDHIIPLEMRGEDAIDNLQPLCTACHKRKTKTDKGHIAKAKRMDQRQAGIRRQSRSSFPTNKDGKFKAKIGGGIEKRWKTRE